jgi:D-xylulose kinase
MSNDLVLVIDAGTSGCRAIVFDADGELMASAYNEFPTAYPKPDRVEQNAEDWWSAICTSTRAVMEECYDVEGDIEAVTVTNQRETVVAVDGSGKPLRPALVWQDRRAVEECEWLLWNVGAEKIHEVTGLTIDPYFTAPKLLWLKEHEKDIFNKTDLFLLVHDYIIYKLTGRAVTEYSNASRTMLFELLARNWSLELLDKMDIPAEKLPEALPPGSFAAELSAGAADETGLPDGVHVYTGGGDQQCAALGCGVTERGRVKATTGTGTFMLAYSKDILFDKKRRVLCSAHVLPDTFVIEASMFTTGAAYRWLRNNFARELLSGDSDPYESLNAEAENSEPGARGVTFIPHLAGAGAPHWNPKAMGTLHGLSLGHNRGDIVRGMMEGTAVELRKNLEVLTELELAATELRVTGGGARSKLWCQIYADMCGIPVSRSPTEDATALGAAVLAAAGAKIHKNLKEAQEAMIKTGTGLKPNKKIGAFYQNVYDRSLKLYELTTSGENQKTK